MDRTPAQIACDVFLSWASPGARLTHHSQTPNAMFAWEKAVQAVMPHEPTSRAELLEEAQQRAFRECRSVEEVLLDMLMVRTGKKVSGTLVIVAPPEDSDRLHDVHIRASECHDGPVIILSHNWQAMSGDELRAELDRIEAAQLRDVLNKSDKAMFALLSTHLDKLDRFDSSAKKSK